MDLIDRIFSCVSAFVVLIFATAYVETASRGSIITEQIMTVTSTWVTTETTFHEPMATVLLWSMVAFFACLLVIGPITLIAWKSVKWWKSRASPTVNRFVTLRFHVTNDSDSSEVSQRRWTLFGQHHQIRRGYWSKRFMTQINGGSPREVRLASISVGEE